MDALLMMEATRTPAANDFTAFKRAMWRNYQHAPHLALIDSALIDVARYVESGGDAGCGKLAVFIPPRHGKSQTVSRLYPAWFLGRNPDKRVILTGYGADLVHKHSRFARNIALTDAYGVIFPGVRVAQDSAARDAWDIEGHDGGLDAMGLDGAVTGKGAHILIIDDAHKNRKEAESKSARQKVWDAYSDDFYTRLEPGGAVVLIMTRWHGDDLGGRLLASEGEDWRVIRLPALAEDNDPMGRAEGEALWAARFPAESIRDKRATLGAYSFAALYQQAPKQREGSLFRFDWIDERRVVTAPPLKRVVIAIDPAVSAADTSDETGIIVIGATLGKDRHAYILHDGSMRGSPNDWARRAVALYRQYKADAIVIEVNQGGDMAEHTLRTVDKSVRIRLSLIHI